MINMNKRLSDCSECPHCRGMFEPKDGYESKKWYPNKYLCAFCSIKENKEIKIDNLKTQITEAKCNIKELKKEIKELKRAN